MRRPLVFGSVSLLVVIACGGSSPPAPTPVVPVGTSSAAPLTRGQCTPYVAETKKVEPKDDPEPDEDHVGRRKKRQSKDLCETADENLARAEAAIVADAKGGAIAPAQRWDGKAAPANLDKVVRRLALSKAEREMLAKNRFVVLARDERTSYAWAYHDVYQSELPIYVSADAILHAVYASNDALIADIEHGLRAPLATALSAMHCALASASYPPEIARDVDVYLTVARSLLADGEVASVHGTDAEARALVASAKAAKGMQKLELFGRERLVDWSQYEPRGHYADKKEEGVSSSRPSLEPFFRASMWLSRLEMNLVSRSSRSSLLGAPDPRETPREAIVALAISDLVERAHVAAEIERLDQAWALLGGRREDVSVADLAKLRAKAGIGAIELGAFEKLKAAIGNDFQRTARLHPMPEGSHVLPAIMTLLGPRVVADTAAFRPLVHSQVNERYLVHAGDVATVLGLDRGKVHLKGELAEHPELGRHLDVAKKTLDASLAKDAGDLYGAWLGALRGVATKPKGTLPSFMETEAYDDLRMNTIVAGYGQLRHNYVLIAGQSYDEGGCVIPDGFVEPLPDVYERIGAYAARGAKVMKALDPKDELHALGYFAELGKVARVLATIARHELEGRALTTEEKRWLSMVTEMSPGGTGHAPTYTGWYFDLFRGRADEALAETSFVADYHTSAFKGKVVYAGAERPRLGVFVVDSGGPPRTMVGPVANAYELVGDLDKRFSDETVKEAPGKVRPWAASYTAPSAKDRPIAASLSSGEDENGKKKPLTVTLLSTEDLGDVVVELLDHHGNVVVSSTRRVTKKKTTIGFGRPAKVQGLRVRIGERAYESFGTSMESPSITRGGVSLYEEP